MGDDEDLIKVLLLMVTGGFEFQVSFFSFGLVSFKLSENLAVPFSFFGKHRSSTAFDESE